MKVLDYEQVNGDQDKYDTAMLPPSRNKHHKHQETKNENAYDDQQVEQRDNSRHRIARRPVFNHENMSSYMHGGHIPSRVAGGRMLVDESRPSSGETAVTETQHITPVVDDLNVPEQRKLSLPERMV
jgi:hypothetical protein